MHPSQLPPEQFRAQVRLDFTRGPGPGGQHRNKADTAVRAVHLPTGVQAIAGERRSRDANERQALKRLRLKVALLHREQLAGLPEGEPYEPSALWQERRIGNRLVVSPRHRDFPALLAEALDVLDAVGEDLPRAARILELSTGQLVRFLSLQPEVLSAVNERRRQRGLRPYQ